MDEDNRLTQVSWDGAVGGYHAARFHSGKYHAAAGTATQWTVDYTYDSAGRMLTRDGDKGNRTRFYWDGWQMIREVTGESVTEYLIPEGTMLSFKRDDLRFDCHVDALGSVRLVTDDAGEVISRFEWGAYGEKLAGSFDGVPGGMPSGWVGALGVRVDPITGLYYMRERWYSPATQNFLSRDPKGLGGEPNLYGYVGQSPTNFIDPIGLDRTRFVLDGNYYPYPGSKPIPMGKATPEATAGFLESLAIALGSEAFFALRAFLRGLVGLKSVARPGWLASLLSLSNETAECTTVCGPFASTTRETLERLANAGGPTTKLTTNLSAAPRLGRGLSTAVGNNAEALAGQATGGGKYTLNVPNGLLAELERTGLATRSTTHYRGVVGSEIRFTPQASEYIIPFVEQ